MPPKPHGRMPHTTAAAIVIDCTNAMPSIGADSTMRSNQRWPRCAARMTTVAPIEWPSAKIGGGQSGNTTSRMNVSRSVSNSEKLPTWPLRRSPSARSDRPWPRQSRMATAKSAAAQIANGLEIFLDPLGAAGKNTHRAAAAGRRRKAGEAQRHAVRRLQHAGDDVVRNRICGNRDELHKSLFTKGLRPLAGTRGYPHLHVCAGQYTAAHHPQDPAPQGGSCMSLQKEDMPCELSILHPFIVPPSALTGCFRCSTRAVDGPVPGLPAL